MRRRRSEPGKYRVPPTAIRREIRKAQKKLRALRRKVSLEKQKEINLKIKALRRCDKLLDDIWEG